MVVTPASISPIPNIRSQVGWPKKLKSPYPTVVNVSVEKYSASMKDISGRW